VESIYAATEFPPISSFCKKNTPHVLEPLELLETELYGAMFSFPGTACLRLALGYFGLPADDFTEDELESLYVPEEKLHLLQKYIMICPEEWIYNHFHLIHQTKANRTTKKIMVRLVFLGVIRYSLVYPVQHISCKSIIKTYTLAKDRFIEKLDSGEWSNMMDHLKGYNLRDCQMLETAWENYCENFYNDYNIDCSSLMSLRYVIYNFFGLEHWRLFFNTKFLTYALIFFKIKTNC